LSFLSKIFKKGQRSGKKSDLPSAIAFVDYEHWFISMETKYNATPDIDEWFESLKKRCNITEVIFFANFSKFEHKEEEVKKIRAFTNKIIDTFNPDRVSEKDYTDFIILDNIYQSIIQNDKNDMYILFTGDGHFNSVIAFLKTFCGKEVGVYGVKGCINKNLYSSANWVVEVEYEAKTTEKIYDCIFRNLDMVRNTPGLIPTFRKTVQVVSSQNNIPDYLAKNSLLELIGKGYIKQVTRPVPKGSSGDEGESIRALVVDWKRVSRDKLWTPGGRSSNKF